MAESRKMIGFRTGKEEHEYLTKCAEWLGLSLAQLVRSSVLAAVGSEHQSADSYPQIRFTQGDVKNDRQV